MRLNRVLQLTAGVTIAMAASIFTISCGEDGSTGKDGTDCIVTGSEAPFAIICGGQPAGFLNDGETGLTGPNGAPGQPGQQGVSCIVSKQGSSWDILCDGDKKGSLDGCSISQSAINVNEIAIDCGETHVDLCNNVVLGEGNVCLSSGAQQAAQKCAGVAYDQNKKFCGFASKAALTAATPTAIDLCGTSGKPNEARRLFTTTDKTDTTWALTSATLTSNNDVIDSTKNVWKDEYCGVTRTASATMDYTKDYSNDPSFDVKSVETPAAVGSACAGLKFNENSWKGEYCGFRSGSNTKEKLSDACNNGAKPNENAATDQYCQMKEKTHKYSQLSSATCGAYTVSLDAGLTDLVKTYYGAKQKINEIANKPVALLTEGDFLNQYCGYNAADFEKTRKSVMDVNDPNHSKPDTVYVARRDGAANVCTDGNGVNAENVYEAGIENYLIGEKKGESGKEFPDWKNQYCVATFNSPETSPTGGETAYCMKDASGANATTGLKNYTTATATARMNEGSWKGEYCGYATATSFYQPGSSALTTVPPVLQSFTNSVPTVLKSCDGATKDIVSSSSTAGYNTPNEKTVVEALKYWPNQYCQYGPTGFSRVAGIQVKATSITNIATVLFADGTTAPEKILNNFSVAVADTDGTNEQKNYHYLRKFMGLFTTTDYTVSKLNEGSWKNGGQYTGIKDTNDFKASTKSKYSVLTGACIKDGTVLPVQPNDWTKAKGTSIANSTLNEWPNEYCQYDKNGNGTVVGLYKYGTADNVSTMSERTTMDDFVDVYCLTNALDITAFNDATNKLGFFNSKITPTNSANHLNKGSWKREYCGYAAATDIGKKFTRIGTLTGTTGVCDDGGKPNEAKSSYTSWTGEYCQAVSTGETYSRGGELNYCGLTAAENALANATDVNRVNLATWKGEFCFADNVRAQCLGGQLPIPSAKSTDNPKCRMP